jgi:hypothetical protein
MYLKLAHYWLQSIHSNCKASNSIRTICVGIILVISQVIYFYNTGLLHNTKSSGNMLWIYGYKYFSYD